MSRYATDPDGLTQRHGHLGSPPGAVVKCSWVPWRPPTRRSPARDAAQCAERRRSPPQQVPGAPQCMVGRVHDRRATAPRTAPVGGARHADSMSTASAPVPASVRRGRAVHAASGPATIGPTCDRQPRSRRSGRPRSSRVRTAHGSTAIRSPRTSLATDHVTAAARPSHRLPATPGRPGARRPDGRRRRRGPHARCVPRGARRAGGPRPACSSRSAACRRRPGHRHAPVSVPAERGEREDQPVQVVVDGEVARGSRCR